MLVTGAAFTAVASGHFKHPFILLTRVVTTDVLFPK